MFTMRMGILNKIMNNMKKIFYILASMLLCLTACQREALVNGDGRSTTVPPAPDALGAVEFTVDYPESGLGTRATMGETNIPSKLYVAVFAEDNGYLQNWIPVEMVQPAVTPAPGMKVTYKYKAYLPINSNEIFHFIGDPPTESPVFSYEDEFIKSMVTTGKEGAFWQRVKVKGGVAAKRNADGSYDLDENGNYKLDLNANGYNADTNPNPLRHVVMIRNFAKIDVQSGDPHFDVLQWALVNVPKSGTVAPWSGQKTGSVVGFDVPYTSIKDYLPETEGGNGKHKLGTFYDDLVKLMETGYTGYYGTVPTIVSTLNPVELKAEDLIDQSEPSAFVKPDDSDSGIYMYERPVPDLTVNQPPTRLLVQLKWNSLPDGASGITVGAEQWYLIDVLDDHGEYMPILRNIKYKMHLSGIDEGGYATSTLAFNGNVFGNVSTALETSMLNEITVGDSKIVVANLDYPFFNESYEEGTLEFQYYPDKDGYPIFKSDPTTVDETARKHVHIVLKSVPGYDPAILSLSNIKDQIPEEGSEDEWPTLITTLDGTTSTITHADGNWGVIPFTLDKSGDKMKKSIIRVQGSIGNGRPIFREVMYTVMAQPDFTESTTVSALTSDASGQDVTVTIGLPEGLGSSMFPIQVRIEAENGCLSTTATELPVKDDYSTFVTADESTQAGKRTFYYIRTIEYSEYYDATRTPQYVYTFDCAFKTTKTSGNAPTRIKLSDSQGRFNSKILDLKVGSGS